METSFSEICERLLNTLLFFPSSTAEFWVSLSLALAALVFVLFQTQAYFGAQRSTLPVAVVALLMAGGIAFFSAAAVRYYVLGWLPEEFFPSLHNLVQSTLGQDWNILLDDVKLGTVMLVGMAMLFTVGSAATAGLFGSRWWDACFSWLAALAAAGVMVFLSQFGFQQFFPEKTVDQPSLQEPLQQPEKTLKNFSTEIK